MGEIAEWRNWEGTEESRENPKPK